MISKIKLQKGLTASIYLLLLILIVSICILAWVPPVSRDALVHHLAVPKMWIKHGGIYEIPELVFSYYPMNLDLLYTIPLYFGNDILPNYLHFAFALATSWLIFSYLKKRLEKTYALLGVLLFLSTPVIVKLSISAYVDLGLVFFSMAALVSILKWCKESIGTRYLVMAGLFCGLALGTKYNGLMVFFLMTLLIVSISFRKIPDDRTAPNRSLLYIMIFIVVAGLIYAPWGIKNYLWTGEILCIHFLTVGFIPGNPTKPQHCRPFSLRKLIYDETWWEIVLVPLRIFFEGRDDAPQYFDGRLNPALILLPVFAFNVSIKDRNTVAINAEKAVLLVFSILLVLIVFFTTDFRIRYIAPAIPCLVVLSMFGLNNIFSFIGNRFAGDLRRIFMGITLAVVALLFSLNAAYVTEQFQILTPIQYQNGTIKRDQYIEKYRPEYAAIQYANDMLPPTTKILALFIGSRGYYSDREMHFDLDLFHSVVQQSDSIEDMRTKFVEFGFSHILIRFDMLDNWCNNRLDQIKKQMVINFFTASEFSFVCKK